MTKFIAKLVGIITSAAAIGITSALSDGKISGFEGVLILLAVTTAGAAYVADPTIATSDKP